MDRGSTRLLSQAPLRGVLGAALFAFALAGPAIAQDLGAQWVDRIGSELRAEKTPLEGSQFSYGAEAGALYVYDNNIFLTQNNRTADSIWVPYAQARLGYTEPQFEVQADLEADYKYYVNTPSVRGNEERFFADIGYAGPVVGGSIIQFIRHESDPLDALFATRVERFVTDTIPRFYLDITSALSFEVDGVIQTVHFMEDTLGDNRDNINGRLLGSLVFKGGPLGLDYLVQGGGMWITYQGTTDFEDNSTSPPNVDGAIVRGGVRGDLRPDLYVEALAGVVRVQTEKFELVNSSTARAFALTTADMTVTLVYKAIDRVVLSAAFSRQVAFGFDVDPFQIINRAQVNAEIAAMERLKVQVRLQFDKADSELGVIRNYATAALTGTYTLQEHFILDGGITYRGGKIYGNVTSNQEYTDFIVQVGVAIAW